MSDLVRATIMEGGICKCGHAALTHHKFPGSRCDCCKCWRFKYSAEQTARFLRETDPAYIEQQFKRDVDEALAKMLAEYNLPDPRENA